jgi:hypothetical protein
MQTSSSTLLKPFSAVVPLAALSPKEQRVAPLLFRLPNPPQPRISAEHGTSFADNFLQKQRKQRKAVLVSSFFNGGPGR